MVIVPLLVAAAGGGLLLSSMWMPWATATISYRHATTSMTADAWDVYTWTPYVLGACGAVALGGGLVLAASAAQKKKLSVDLMRFVRMAGAVSAGMMLWRTFFAVGFGQASASAHNILGTGIDISAHRGPGLFIALGAAVAIAAASTWRVLPKADAIEVPAAENVNAYAGAYPAAWYPDPHAPGRERRWDGQRWTWDTRDAVAAEPVS